MRKYKMITTQDHVLILLEVLSTNQEVTCVDKDTNLRGMYPTTSTALFAEGSGNAFLKDASGNWEKIGPHQEAPLFTIINEGAELGGATTSSTYRVIGIHTKDQNTLEQWKPFLTLTDEQISKIIDPDNRESFIEIYSYTMERKMDAETFEEIAETDLVSDSEITFL